MPLLINHIQSLPIPEDRLRSENGHLDSKVLKDGVVAAEGDYRYSLAPIAEMIVDAGQLFCVFCVKIRGIVQARGECICAVLLDI